MSPNERLKKYIAEIEMALQNGDFKKVTVEDISNKVDIPKSTLYKNYRLELDQIKKLQRSNKLSSTKKKLLATRKENRILRDRNQILTTIAHEYFVENESLKIKIGVLKKQQIVRVK